MGLGDALRSRRFQTGRRNLITDVPGVRVGHADLRGGGLQTGVTAVIPHTGNLFRQKLPAAARVFNGFGKSLGLMQIEELGNIETPILLTNTLSVGMAHHALVRYMLAGNPGIGAGDGSVNPVVLECNDGGVNDIRALAVDEACAQRALARAEEDFAEGSRGAGSGMVCYSLKGGIGSASRRAPLYGGVPGCMLGALVLSNFGTLPYFTPLGIRAGAMLTPVLRDLRAGEEAGPKGEQGSIVVILATDAPLDARQLHRLAGRAAVGIARTGSFVAHGSGELALAFTTGNSQSLDGHGLRSMAVARDEDLDPLFAAAAEAVEEAILSSMAHAETVCGADGRTVYSLRDLLARPGVPERLCTWARG